MNWNKAHFDMFPVIVFGLRSARHGKDGGLLPSRKATPETRTARPVDWFMLNLFHRVDDFHFVRFALSERDTTGALHQTDGKPKGKLGIGLQNLFSI